MLVGIIIVLIGIICISIKIKNNKIEEGFSDVLFTSGITLVVTASGDWIDQFWVGLGIVFKTPNPAYKDSVFKDVRAE